MRLAEPPSRPLPAVAEIGETVDAVLDERLAHDGAAPVAVAPIAVALSGGGDSLALLIAAKAWADRRGRRLLALTVDHRLNPASADWTRFCADRARRLGVAFEALAWEADKPATGLPAAARDARHILLANAARNAGARVILIGHTADDVAEAAFMRAEGSTTPSPRLWTPSPAWPEGRGLFLLRPLLGVRRAALRSWLEAQGETWIDDPANEDLLQARARARAAGPEPQPAPELPDVGALALACQEADGWLTIARSALREAEPAQTERFVAIACLCAGGQSRPPRGERLSRLTGDLSGAGRMHATLAGARVEADAGSVRFMREAGRDGLPTIELQLGETIVWDGRFEIEADRPGLSVGPLAGSAKRLGRADRATLKAVPPRARGTLPVIIGGETAFRPTLNAMDTLDGVTILPLAGARLLAACGVVEREPG